MSKGLIRLIGHFTIYKIDPAYKEEIQYWLKRPDPTPLLEKYMLEKREAYGRMTNNFAQLLKAILLPKTTYSAPDTGCHVTTTTVVDETGASKKIGLRGAMSTGGGGYYYSIVFLGIRTVYSYSVTLGSFFKIGSGSTPPSINDYALESPLQEIPASSVNVLSSDSQTIVVLTGSSTAQQDMDVSEAGLFYRGIEYKCYANKPPAGFNILLDRVVFSTIRFAIGDPITIQYKILSS